MTDLFNLHPIINGVGYATRVSGSCPHPDVVAAMSTASGLYFEVDDLLSAASAVIRRCTTAEAGIVTSGASAALSLAAAACLAGNNPEIMDQLPDVSGCPRHEIIYPKPGPFDYDHAIRLSGARTVFADYRAPDALKQIELAINSRTAAIGYVWLRMDETPDLRSLAELARRFGLPLIVDAACALPPKQNLTEFTQCGADLVAYSGGKHLGGPQASGILCGRADLIRSAWVQMVDMDVREGTWSLQHWVSSGWLSRAPRHGIGRCMKVSKESIVGVIAALERYADRDPDEEYNLWKSRIETIFAGISDLPELRVTVCTHGMNGQPYPNLQIESGDSENGMTVRELLLALRQRHPSANRSPAELSDSAGDFYVNTENSRQLSFPRRRESSDAGWIPACAGMTEQQNHGLTGQSSDSAESRGFDHSTNSATLPTGKLPRNIILAEDEQSPDRAFLYAQCLQPGDAEEIVFAIRQAVTTFRDRIRT